MASKVDKMRLSEQQDRRVKLTSHQKELIRKEYALGGIGCSLLGKKYGVSKSLIQIIVNPERAKRVKERHKANWRKYHDRESLTESVRQLRAYKRELLEKGELKEVTHGES